MTLPTVGGIQGNCLHTFCAVQQRIIITSYLLYCNDLGKIIPKHWGQTATPMLLYTEEEWVCASGPFQRAWLRAGANSKATAGPAWLHVWPSAPCVVLGGQRHSIPWRHVCHLEHLVGGSPPRNLGSSCVYTGLGTVLEVCEARFQGPWPSQPLTPQRPKRPSKQGACWLPICSVSEVQAQRSCHHKQLSWRP